MKAMEAVRSIMKRQEMGTSKLAARMGKTPRVVSDRLSQDNISIEKLNEMLRLLDYKIVLLPREARVPEKGYEVE